MTFEWDNEKNEINKEKHDGISFELAVRVFLMKNVLKNMTTIILPKLKTGGM